MANNILFNSKNDLAANAKTKLMQFKTELDSKIEIFLDNELDNFKPNFNHDVTYTLDLFKKAVLADGKRVRGAFGFYVYTLLGGKNYELGYQLAIILEIIQSYLLLIDDFIDKSPQRRGIPTAHVTAKNYFEEQHFLQGESVHFGNSIAILCGLYGCHLAQISLSNLKIEDEMKIRLFKKANNKIFVTAIGETLDVINAAKIITSEEDIIDMFKWKTATYTYENPIHMGAILAGADDTLLDKFTDFATPAGIAFQIHDDILGMFGEIDKTGKSNMDDLKEGKITLLTNYTLLNGTHDQVKILKKYLGNPNITEDDLKIVQKVLIDSGSLDYSKKKSAEVNYHGLTSVAYQPSASFACPESSSP